MESWEERVGGGIWALVIAGAIILATLIIVTIKELATIYVRRAGQRTTAARILWIALAAVVVVALFATSLVMDPATVEAGILLGSWGWGVYAVTVIGVDIYMEHHDSEELKDAGNLDSYVNFAPATPATNGNIPSAAAH